MNLVPDVATVEVRRTSKSFGPTRALNDVSIAFHAGRVHCILGENGAGKSTVGKIVGGLYAPDDGEVMVDGRAVALRQVGDARRLGIAMVYQELSLVADLTVRENICLGTEGARHPFQRLRRRQETEACRALLSRFGLSFDLDAKVGTLPVADQQLLEIVKALAQNPRVLILDEPTAMLGLVEQQRLMEIIGELKTQGIAIIFVTHHVEEVVAVADEVSLMKDGRVVESFPVTRETETAFVVAKLAGGMDMTASHREAAPGREVLRFSGLRSRRGRLAAISLREREIVGLYGVVGCGRERMAHASVGLASPGDIELMLWGRNFRPANPQVAARHGVAYLPSGRAANGILPNRSIRENLMLTQLAGHQIAGFLRHRREADHAERQLARLRTRYADAADAITSLSGGNQQKVILGRCLAGDGSLIVLEDPTAGVDIAAKRDIHDLIRARADAGAAVLLISSDLQETIALCDVIYTVIDGEIVDEYRPPSHEDEAAIVADILGHREQEAVEAAAS
ncbi:sugar ABC transporter ATP-binding protein [Zavarzinia compransoris]|uniref:sugar ABC transporter ATP-binding protein n=1 Tax=Zavarzinia marina TaxID=2911065 RepID=UPI001F336FAB|nr:sugar ABC transporter ATP-binding protein [Zavarzinia marina]MCF4167352.1 sugar ABC transporter ATP-binding protein [Zavarzinia marina]